MKITSITLGLLLAITAATPLRAQVSAFTYQGRLNLNGAPANGSYDFMFRLLNDPTNGVAAPVIPINLAVAVSNGLFTTGMDFGAENFDGANRWLEINVRTNGGGSFTTLSPRQLLTPAPYAIAAHSASNLLGALPAGQISGTILNASLPASPSFSGTVTANNFSGNGAGLMNGNASTFFSSGTLPDARLSANVALKDAVNVFTGSSNVTTTPLVTSNAVLRSLGPNTAILDIPTRGTVAQPSWQIVQGAFTNTSQGSFNEVLSLNWNMHAGIGLNDPAFHGTGLGIESSYNPSGTAEWTEYHLARFRTTNNVNYRVLSGEFDVHNPAASPGWYSHGTWKHWQMTNTAHVGNPFYSVTPNGSQWYFAGDAYTNGLNLTSDGGTVQFAILGGGTRAFRVMSTSLSYAQIAGVILYPNGTIASAGPLVFSDVALMRVGAGNFEVNANAPGVKRDLTGRTATFTNFTTSVGGQFTGNGAGLSNVIARLVVSDKVSVSLTADNQTISTSSRGYIALSSDDATPANRTIVLSAGTAGQLLDLEWIGTNGGELLDDSANFDSGNVRLSADWTPTQYDVLSLRFNGTDWIERSRSAN